MMIRIIVGNCEELWRGAASLEGPTRPNQALGNPGGNPWLGPTHLPGPRGASNAGSSILLYPPLSSALRLADPPSAQPLAPRILPPPRAYAQASRTVGGSPSHGLAQLVRLRRGSSDSPRKPVRAPPATCEGERESESEREREREVRRARPTTPFCATDRACRHRHRLRRHRHRHRLRRHRHRHHRQQRRRRQRHRHRHRHRRAFGDRTRKGPRVPHAPRARDTSSR
jgi:hypothetical protein